MQPRPQRTKRGPMLLQGTTGRADLKAQLQRVIS